MVIGLSDIITVLLIVILSSSITWAADSGNEMAQSPLKSSICSESDDTFQWPEDPATAAIDRRVKDGSKEAVNDLVELLTTYGLDRKLKQQALAGLGRIGSKEAVDGVRTFETWARRMADNPPSFSFGSIDCALDHFYPRVLKPLAEYKDVDGTNWAIFAWQRFTSVERDALWITHSKAEGGWSEPVYLGTNALSGSTGTERVSGVTKEAGRLVLSVQAPLEIDKAKEDTDDDGLTDYCERELSTNPKKADTDGDGVLDAKDHNPLTPADEVASDDIHEIRQAVFSALFSTSNSRDTIWLIGDSDFAKQEYYGYAGFIVKGQNIINQRFNITEFKADISSPDTATASIEDYEGSVAGSLHEAKLRKLHDKWVVVEFKMAWIS